MGGKRERKGKKWRIGKRRPRQQRGEEVRGLLPPTLS